MESAFENRGMQKFLVIPGRPERSRGRVPWRVIRSYSCRGTVVSDSRLPAQELGKNETLPCPSTWLAGGKRSPPGPAPRQSVPHHLVSHHLVCLSQHGSELHAKQPHLGFKEWIICIEQSRKTMEQPACFWVVRSQMEFNYLLFSLSCAFSL